MKGEINSTVELYKFSGIERLLATVASATLAAGSVEERLLHHIIFNGIVRYIFERHLMYESLWFWFRRKNQVSG